MQPKRQVTPTIRHCVHLTLIIIIACYVFSGILNAPADESVNGGDIAYNVSGWNFYEWFLRDSIINERTVPLWLRYRYSGYIYAGDPQIPTYSLSTILLLLSPNELVGIRYGIVLHAVMSGVFMYLLLAVWKQRPEASLIGAVGFMLSGYYFARIFAGHITFLYAYPWMPLVIALHELAIQRSSAKFSALAGLSLSMQLQSGGLVIFLYTILILTIYFLHKMGTQILTSIRNRLTVLNIVKRNAKLLFVTVLFTSTLSAIKILPVIEEMPFTGRGDPFSYEELLKGYVMSFNQIGDLLLYRGQASDVYPYYVFPKWGVWDWWEYWSYMGVPLFILATVGIVFVRKESNVAFLVLATVISVLLARGKLQNIFPMFPMYTLIHIPSRFLVITQFTLPALASIAVTGIQDSLESRVQGIRQGGKLIIRRFDKAVVYGLVLLIAMDLATSGGPLIWTTRVYLPMTDAMKHMKGESGAEVYRVYTTTPSDIYLYSKNRFETTWGPGWEFAIKSYAKYHQRAEMGSYKMLGALNVKYVISNTELGNPEGLTFIQTFSNGESLYHNQYYLGRLWTVPRALLVISSDQNAWEEESIRLMNDLKFDPRTTLLIRGIHLDDFTPEQLQRFDAICFATPLESSTHSVDRGRELITRYRQGGGAVLNSGESIPDEVWTRASSPTLDSQPEITEYTPNDLQADVYVEQPVFLLISEVNIPGWRVYVDKSEVAAFQANDIFLAVDLTEGKHSITVQFRPLSYEVGRALTLVAYLGLALLLLPRFATAKLARGFREIRRRASQVRGRPSSDYKRDRGIRMCGRRESQVKLFNV